MDKIENKKIVTRFAPSPTGFLHIGNARTALFNWVFTRHVGGTFRLRIEDTDKERSTQAAVDAIIDGLKWLQIDWDGDIIFQAQRQNRHLEAANMLLESGRAYKCYMTTEEIENYKKNNPHKKIYSPWSNPNYKPTIPGHTRPTIRLRASENNCEEKEISIQDTIQGRVTINRDQLDDMILLRSDGTPTYMLAVVVDDHDMGINYVIRGDDHLTNTFRQLQIYEALGWEKPQYAHIPLIHSEDGTKMSKRHGATKVGWYREAGYLPEAVKNYLLRLGWSHGDQEIFSMDEAIKLFELKDVNKAPSRFDMNKLNSINSHYIKVKNNEELLGMIMDKLKINDYLNLNAFNKIQMSVFIERINKAIDQLKQRAKTINEMSELAMVYIAKQNPLDEKSQEVILKPENHALINDLVDLFQTIDDDKWYVDELKSKCEIFASIKEIKAGVIFHVLRAYVLGTFNSPPIYETLAILGKEETLKRISNSL